MPPLLHIDFFSGLGGNSYAADQVWENMVHEFCEINPYCRAILKKHWPNAIIHEDIKKYRGGGPGSAYLVTGGFPCQPFSAAGKKLGTADDRDLWPEMFRVIQEIRPTWFIGENVDDFVEMALDRSISDLEGAGYSVQAFIIPAIAVDARHIRDRCWIVAHANGQGHGYLDRSQYYSGTKGKGESNRKERERIRIQSRGSGSDMADTTFITKTSEIGGSHRGRKNSGAKGIGPAKRYGLGNGSQNISDADSIDGERRNIKSTQRRSFASERPSGLRSRGADADHQEWSVEPTVGRVAHGVPNRVDRLKALGNSIVPQVVEEIMRMVKAVDELT